MTYHIISKMSDLYPYKRGDASTYGNSCIYKKKQFESFRKCNTLFTINKTIASIMVERICPASMQ